MRQKTIISVKFPYPTMEGMCEWVLTEANKLRLGVLIKWLLLLLLQKQ